MSESLELEINDLPPEETLTPEEKERMAGAGLHEGFWANFNSGSPTAGPAMLMYAQHMEAEAAFMELAEEIEQASGCKLIRGQMKSVSRALDKVQRDYHGFWDELKDILRVTFIAEDDLAYQRVADQVKSLGNRAPFRVIKEKVEDRRKHPRGYSGQNYVVEMKLGLTAPGQIGGARVVPGPARPVRMEIQANVPTMIYAKEVKEDFIAMLGNDDYAGRKFHEIESWSHIVSGLSHALYEIWAVADARYQEEANALSERYHRYLRDRVPNGPNDFRFVQLCADLEDFFFRCSIFGLVPKHPVPAQVSVTPHRPVPPSGRPQRVVGQLPDYKVR
jgi:hypothetical protein